MPGDPPSPEGQQGLAKAVYELRRKADLSQAELAAQADLPASVIAQIESGIHDPLWGDVRRVAQALGISLEALSELAEQHQLDREV